MNITLVRRPRSLYKTEVAGNYIAEYYQDENRPDRIHIRLYDPANNTVFSITPERRKVAFIEIVNCIWNCRDIYYASCELAGSSRLEISIFKYQTDTQTDSKVCSFIKSVDILDENRRVKLFLLSESMILMQTETLRRDMDAGMMGSIEFLLTLYNLDSGEETGISEANLLNNGIHRIIPASDSKIMIKTGYSYLEDERMRGDGEREALIESVYVTTTAKFIADILLTQDFVDMPLIESAYLDKHIISPKVTDNYTHFCIADPEHKTTKCVFYHNETGERMEYTVNSFDPGDLYLSYVIGKTPYVRKSVPGEVSFFNLKKAETDLFFYEEQFLDQIGTLLLFSGDRKSRGKDLRVYDYPKLNQVLKERREYGFGCCLHGDYYIYC